MKKKLCLLAAPLLLVGGAQAATTVALLDFGQTGGTIDTAGGGTTGYNNIDAGSAANNKSVTQALNESDGSATGWTLNFLENGTGSAGSSGSGGWLPNDTATYVPSTVSTLHPASATRDNIFINEQAGSNASFVITFSGLDDSMIYDLEFFGSRVSTSTVEAIWDMTTGTGGNSAATFITLPQNLTQVQWNGISPVGGNIVFTAHTNGATGSSQRPISLSAGSITQVPEPSSTALLGLGGLALILRRRK